MLYMYETLGHYVLYCSLYLSIPPSSRSLPPSLSLPLLYTIPNMPTANEHPLCIQIASFLSRGVFRVYTSTMFGRVKNVGHTVASGLRFVLQELVTHTHAETHNLKANSSLQHCQLCMYTLYVQIKHALSVFPYTLSFQALHLQDALINLM